MESNLAALRCYQRLGVLKVGQDVWSPPDGGAVTKFRYAWRCLEALLQPAWQMFPDSGMYTAFAEVRR